MKYWKSSTRPQAWAQLSCRLGRHLGCEFTARCWAAHSVCGLATDFGGVFALRAPCVHPACYFYDDFPKLSPQVDHYRMKPLSRPTDASCLPNEATNHPCTPLNRLPQIALSSGLLTVSRDLLHDDSLVLRVITHLVADVGIRALSLTLTTWIVCRHIWSWLCCRCIACRRWMLLPSRWPRHTFRLYMIDVDP